MPKSRIPYPPEFRQQMIELVRSGLLAWLLGQRVRALCSDDPNLGKTSRPR